MCNYPSREQKSAFCTSFFPIALLVFNPPSAFLSLCSALQCAYRSIYCTCMVKILNFAMAKKACTKSSEWCTCFALWMLFQCIHVCTAFDRTKKWENRFQRLLSFLSLSLLLSLEIWEMKFLISIRNAGRWVVCYCRAVNKTHKLFTSLNSKFYDKKLLCNSHSSNWVSCCTELDIFLIIYEVIHNSGAVNKQRYMRVMHFDHRSRFYAIFSYSSPMIIHRKFRRKFCKTLSAINFHFS